MGKVHQRISDTNKLRKLRFGQATMLGITFRQRDAEWRTKAAAPYGGAQWEFQLPDTLQPPGIGYASGYFRRRWECVDSALRLIGVIR